MKFVQGKLALAMIIAGSVALGGCFGPFKKKSSGGGGGGGAEEEEPADDPTKKEAGETSGETPAPTTPATPPPPGAKDGYGCLQGVVTDGFTGQRLKLADPKQVFVLIRGTKIAANTVDGLDGEYFICDIPVEETYPVYAYVSGYMPFESSVLITSTRAKRVAADGQAVVDEVKIPDPLEMQNIRLFPLGNTTRDLRVRAVHNGSPVKDAIVDLEAQAAGAAATFAFEGTFANNAGTRILPTRVLTGDDGYATFKAADLSLGAAYSIKVHPPITSNLTAAAHANIVLGVSGALATDLNTYDMNVLLDEGNQALKLISCSTQFANYNGDGTIKFLFNREVRIVNPDNLDNSTTISANNLIGVAGTPVDFKDDDATNDDAKVDSLTLSMSGNILTVTPVFNANGKPKGLTADDPDNATVNSVNKNASVTYDFSKFLLDVVGNELVNKVALSSLVGGANIACPSTVRFFQEID